jgi:hypothetical protein
MLGMGLIAAAVMAVTLFRGIPDELPRQWYLGCIALLLQVPVYLWGWSDWLLRSAYLLLLVVAYANRHLVGGQIIGIGLLLNATPILVYGRMPISAEMMAWGGHPTVPGTALLFSKDLVVERSALALLGDIVPVSILDYRAAWSIGDILLCLGIARYCWNNPTQAPSNEVGIV